MIKQCNFKNLVKFLNNRGNIQSKKNTTLVKYYFAGFILTIEEL